MNAFSFSPVTALFNHFLTCHELVPYVLCVFRGKSNIHSNTLERCNENIEKALRSKNRSMVALHVLLFLLPLRTSVIRAHVTINPRSRLHLSNTALIKRMKEKETRGGARALMFTSIRVLCILLLLSAFLSCHVSLFNRVQAVIVVTIVFMAY